MCSFTVSTVGLTAPCDQLPLGHLHISCVRVRDPEARQQIMMRFSAVEQVQTDSFTAAAFRFDQKTHLSDISVDLIS